ncbi:MAG: S8 family serine peptidase, partial [Owenweeksia sp.]
SAGNEGSGSWKYITAPADGDSVLAIGGVNSSGDRVSFSSIGPSADGRIKPDVMAQGGSTAYATGGSALTGNGTSFSCPIVAGMAACLWQSNITKSNMEIYNEIRLSGSRSFNPDNEYGYGIPNFEHAFYQVISLDEMLSDLKVDVFPNPVKDLLNIRISDLQGEWDMTLVVRDIAGNELLSLTSELQNPEFSVDFPFAKGIYIVNLTIGDHTLVKKILK